MEYSQEIMERIEQYLAGELQGNTLTEFEKQIQENPKLQVLVASQKDIMSGIQKSTYQDLKSQMNTFHEEMIQENKVSESKVQDTSDTKIISLNQRRKLWRNIGIAASLIFALSFGYYLLNSNQSSADQEIYAEGQDVLLETILPVTTLTGESTDKIIEIFVSYTEGEKDRFVFENGLLEIFTAKKDSFKKNDISILQKEDELFLLKIRDQYFSVFPTDEPKELLSTEAPVQK